MRAGPDPRDTPADRRARSQVFNPFWVIALAVLAAVAIYAGFAVLT